MKKIIFTICFAIIGIAVQAQDIIVFHDANEVEAKVTNISPDAVTYKRFDNLEGPSYTIAKSDIFFIKYANGTKDIFGEHTSARNKNSSLTPDIKFQGYATLGAIVTSGGLGSSVDVSFGTRIGKALFVGFETGIHSVISYIRYYTYDGGIVEYEDLLLNVENYIPLAVNIKGFLPTRNDRFFPYLNCSLGGFVGVGNLRGLNGFYCQVGAGIDYRRFTVGVGYSCLHKFGTVNSGYLKLGVRFGESPYAKRAKRAK